MKNKLKVALIPLYTLSFLMMTALPLLAQSEVEISRNIILENDSNEENVVIPVQERGSYLEIRISAEIFEGRIELEIYPPSGGIEWNLTVGNQTESYEGEQVTGRIKRFLSEPEPGDWTVKLKPENAVGSVQIMTKISGN
jgi:hypothetical protein